MADDKMKREIEDILNRLDSFVPEESAISRMRRRSSGGAANFARALLGPLARISLGQVLLTSLALIIIAFFGRISGLPCAKNGDVNESGGVTIADAQLIAQLIVGRIPSLPPP
jgi:hypothetical protein